MSGHAAAKNRSLLTPMLFFLLCLGVVLVGFFSNANLKLSPRLLYHHLSGHLANCSSTWEWGCSSVRPWKAWAGRPVSGLKYGPW